LACGKEGKDAESHAGVRDHNHLSAHGKIESDAIETAIAGALSRPVRAEARGAHPEQGCLVAGGGFPPAPSLQNEESIPANAGPSLESMKTQ
jgi:hypothetical protein